MSSAGQPSDIALSSGLSAAAEIPAMLVMGGIAARFGVRAHLRRERAPLRRVHRVVDRHRLPLAIVATRAVTGIAFSGVVVSVVLTIAVMLPARPPGDRAVPVPDDGVRPRPRSSPTSSVGSSTSGFGPAALFGTGAVLALVAAVVGWLAFPGRQVPRAVRRSDP